MGKQTMRILAIGFLLCAASQARSQGTFQNLDFESANVPDVPQNQFGTDVLVSDGVPGWSVYIGTNAQATMLHNNIPLSAAGVAILGPNWAARQILQGSYSVDLLGSSPPLLPVAVAIAQTGEIPVDARSLTFELASGPGFQVTFEGQAISIFPIGATTNYTVFGADITAFAGTTGELRFTCPPNIEATLDNISFSASVIPEPGTAGLALTALATIWTVRRLRKKAP